MLDTESPKRCVLWRIAGQARNDGVAVELNPVYSGYGVRHSADSLTSVTKTGCCAVVGGVSGGAVVASFCEGGFAGSAVGSA